MRCAHFLVLDKESSPSRGLALGHCGAHALHPFAYLGNARATIRRRIHQFFNVREELRAKGGPDLSEKRFQLGENTKMFAICIVEKLDVNGAMVDERCCHLPITHYHTEMPAMLAHYSVVNVCHRFRIEIAEEIVTTNPHGWLPAQVIKFQNEIGF